MRRTSLWWDSSAVGVEPEQHENVLSTDERQTSIICFVLPGAGAVRCRQG